MRHRLSLSSQTPKYQVKHEYLEFSVLERKIYDSLYEHAKIDFNRLTEKGLVGKKYTHILAMLMRSVVPFSMKLSHLTFSIDFDEPSCTQALS